MKNTFALIMAGGVGSRFWPYSREAFPKQFQDILGVGSSLLQLTAQRLLPLVSWENQLVLTNEKYKALVKKQLPKLPEANILTEPLRKNTAPCVAYAGFEVLRRNPNAQLITTPADHFIVQESAYQKALSNALQFTQKEDAILTLGIAPTRPDTGYGYIQQGEDSAEKDVYKVKRFTEKPEKEKAEAFLREGGYFWNAGIFVWSAKTLAKAFQVHAPALAALFEDANSPEKVQYSFENSPEISIDYAIMEKADNIYVLPVSCGWSDLGTWKSLHEVVEKDKNDNVLSGKILTYGVKGSIIKAPKDRLIVAQGLENYIVAEYDNALLICQRDQEQQIKAFLEDAKAQGSEFA